MVVSKKGHAFQFYCFWGIHVKFQGRAIKGSKVSFDFETNRLPHQTGGDNGSSQQGQTCPNIDVFSPAFTEGFLWELSKVCSDWFIGISLNLWLICGLKRSLDKQSWPWGFIICMYFGTAQMESVHV